MTTINQNLGKYLREKTANKGMKYKNPIQVSILNPNSRKHAIFAHCFDCCGGNISGDNTGVKSEIRNCEITNCSLHKFRPYKNEKALKVSTLASALDSSSRNHEDIQNDIK